MAKGACMATGVCMVKGACVVRGTHGGGMLGSRDGHCSGRYAFYWNAFLLHKVATRLKLYFSCRKYNSIRLFEFIVR